MSDLGSARMSRRALLRSGLVGAAGMAVPGLVSPAAGRPADPHLDPGALRTVTPIRSHDAYLAFGVCALPHHNQTSYRHTREWMAALATTGASYFRGMYAHQLPSVAVATERARAHGLRWGMTVCPDLSFDDDRLRARLEHLAANAADLCLFVEGVNEPNHVRGGGAVRSDWVDVAVAKQRLIWEAVRSDPRLSHVKVVGPSLHAVAGTEDQYEALADAGLPQYMDYAGVHRYHGGRYPDHLLDERLAWVRTYWDDKPVWITETGYTNALGARTGHRPTPEDVSATYAPAALLEAIDRGCRVSWFELLDDPDPGKEEIEANFGMYAPLFGDAPLWRPKPVVAAVRLFLDALRDPGPDFDPRPVQLAVTASTDDVRETVTAKRDGSVTVHLRRATNRWDPERQERLTVAPVDVTIRTSQTTRTVSVDHRVRSVEL